MTAAVALAGFVLGAARPRSARAWGASDSTSSSTDETTSGTSGSCTDATEQATTVTVVSTGVVTVVVVVAVVVSNGRGQPQGLEAVAPEPVIGEATWSLLQAGLLTARGDLGMQLALVVDSPAAFDLMSDDAERGTGPALTALASAANLPEAVVAERWLAARDVTGPVTDRAGALQFVWNFAARIAHDLQIPGEAAASFAWQLLVERRSPAFPEEATAHAWLASWLGVPVEAAGDATARVFRGMDGLSEGDAQTRVETNSVLYLRRISIELELEHKPAIDARTQELLSHLPPAIGPAPSPPSGN